MDAFFASIEQAINPRLRGKPLIVGSRKSRMHTVVCAASYEAKAYGIDSGMSTKEAFLLCPQAEFVAADQSKYIWTSEQIFRMLGDYGLPLVYSSIDEFQVDIAGCQNPLELALNIQKKIRDSFNIGASIGIAKNYLLAKLASKINKPNGVAILGQGNLEGILGGLAVGKLCGIGQANERFLEFLGIKTCLDLYQKSCQFLESHLGKNGVNLYLALHTQDRFDPSQRAEIIKSVGHSYTLARPSQNRGFIQGWIRLLSEMVAHRLREKNLGAKTVHLWLSGPEIRYFGQQATYKEPTNDGYEIYLRTMKIIRKSWPQMARIRGLGVSTRGLFPAEDLTLLKEDIKRRGLTQALDSINNKFGEWSIYPAVISLAKQSQRYSRRP
jgi:DNA polymerase-4